MFQYLKACLSSIISNSLCGSTPQLIISIFLDYQLTWVKAQVIYISAWLSYHFKIKKFDIFSRTTVPMKSGTMKSLSLFLLIASPLPNGSNQKIMKIERGMKNVPLKNQKASNIKYIEHQLYFYTVNLVILKWTGQKFCFKILKTVVGTSIICDRLKFEQTKHMILEAIFSTSLGSNRCHNLVVVVGGEGWVGWIVPILHTQEIIYINKIIKKEN